MAGSTLLATLGSYLFFALAAYERAGAAAQAQEIRQALAGLPE